MLYTSCSGKPRRVSATALRGNGFSPLEPERVYYPPAGVFARARHRFAPVTTGSLSLLLTVAFDPVTVRRLMRKVVGPVNGSLCKLQAALSSLQDLD